MFASMETATQMRHAIMINVIAPGEEDEDAILARAARLNPAESLTQLYADLGITQ